MYARAKDEEVVSQAAEAAKKSFVEISGRDVEVVIEATLSDEL